MVLLLYFLSHKISLGEHETFFQKHIWTSKKHYVKAWIFFFLWKIDANCFHMLTFTMKEGGRIHIH